MQYLKRREMDLLPQANSLQGQYIERPVVTKIINESKVSTQRLEELGDGRTRIVTTDYFMRSYDSGGKMSTVYSTGQYVDIMV